MSGQVSRGSADEYQAHEWAGIAWTSWRVTWGQKGHRCIGAQACSDPASDVDRRLGVLLDAGGKANNDGRDCVTDKEPRLEFRREAEGVLRGR